MGYVYPPDFSPVRPDMVPLFSWYSSGRQDNWLTTAHDAEGAARQGLMPGYGFVRLEGYALRD
jgi:hypothetical protein